MIKVLISLYGSGKASAYWSIYWRGSASPKRKALTVCEAEKERAKKERYMDISVKRLAKTAIANRD